MSGGVRSVHVGPSKVAELAAHRLCSVLLLSLLWMALGSICGAMAWGQSARIISIYIYPLSRTPKEDNEMFPG